MRLHTVYMFIYLVNIVHCYEQIPPACTTCKHFIPHDKIFRLNGAEKGKCSKVFHFNLATGNKVYDLASFARKHEELCGINGTHHVKYND